MIRVLIIVKISDMQGWRRCIMGCISVFREVYGDGRSNRASTRFRGFAAATWSPAVTRIGELVAMDFNGSLWLCWLDVISLLFEILIVACWYLITCDYWVKILLRKFCCFVPVLSSVLMQFKVLSKWWFSVILFFSESSINTRKISSSLIFELIVMII